MAYEYLRCTLESGVARLTLCRPDRANSINLACARELNRAAQELRDDGRVRVVVIAAEGRIFCAGGDITSFPDAAEELPTMLRAILDEMHSAIEIFSGMDAPVIAQIAGTVAGAGLGLVSATSLAYATVDSKFTMSFTGIGLTPDSGATWFLPRLIGWRRAEELILTNRVLGAKEAAEWGLLNECHADAASLEEAVSRIALRLAAGPTRAFGGVKRLLSSSASNGLSAQLAAECESIVARGGESDAREGVAAFRNKRKPVFTGR